MRISGSRLAQALRERVRQARQCVSALVMRVYGQSIEAGERLVDADEAQLRVAQPQADGNVPDGVQEAPGGVLFLGRGRHGRQLALNRRIRGCAPSRDQVDDLPHRSAKGTRCDRTQFSNTWGLALPP